MNNQTEYRIKNVAVTLYAFQFRTGFGEAGDAPLLWENLENAGETLFIPELQRIREKLICYKDGQYRPELETGDRRPSPLPLLRHPEDRLEFGPISRGGKLSFSGSLIPVRLHDAYAADLTLACNNEMDVSQLSQFNLRGCLLPERIQASLGQTLILYAEPSHGTKPDRRLADECINAFLKDSDDLIPKFGKAGRIFGSHVFEYENETFDPRKRLHIWVWLNENPQAAELLEEMYDEFTNLLLCRNKVLFAYHESAYCFRNARNIYEELENRSKGLDNLLNKDREERLKKLEPLLAEMPSASVDYDRHIRDMEDHSTTIRVNAENYLNSLDKISSQKLPEDDMTFLKDFHNRAIEVFDHQIRIDLAYLFRGQRLSREIIRTIRGMTEIDILKQLKENEESGSRRQNELEILVTLIVVTLEIGTISAAINPRLLGLDCHIDKILTHILIGLPFGLIAALILKAFQWWRR
jgi:hypothetical protein